MNNNARHANIYTEYSSTPHQHTSEALVLPLHLPVHTFAALGIEWNRYHLRMRVTSLQQQTQLSRQKIESNEPLAWTEAAAANTGLHCRFWREFLRGSRLARRRVLAGSTPPPVTM